MAGHKDEEMTRKKRGNGGKMRYGMTAGGNALARRDNDKKRTGMMMGGGMKTSGSQPSYAHGANGGMGGPL